MASDLSRWGGLVGTWFFFLFWGVFLVGVGVLSCRCAWCDCFCAFSFLLFGCVWVIVRVLHLGLLFPSQLLCLSSVWVAFFIDVWLWTCARIILLPLWSDFEFGLVMCGLRD